MKKFIVLVVVGFICFASSVFASETIRVSCIIPETDQSFGFSFPVIKPSVNTSSEQEEKPSQPWYYINGSNDSNAVPVEAVPIQYSVTYEIRGMSGNQVTLVLKFYAGQNEYIKLRLPNPGDVSMGEVKSTLPNFSHPKWIKAECSYGLYTPRPAIIGSN